MSFTDAIVLMLAEIPAIGNGVLGNWVNMTAGVQSPLDTNAALTSSGQDLVGYIASAAVVASNIISVVVEALL